MNGSTKLDWLKKTVERRRNKKNIFFIVLIISLSLVFVVLCSLTIVALIEHYVEQKNNGTNITFTNDTTRAASAIGVIGLTVDFYIGGTIVSGLGLSLSSFAYVSTDVIFFRRKSWIESFTVYGEVTLNYLSRKMIIKTEEGLEFVISKRRGKFRIELPIELSELEKFGLRKSGKVYTVICDEEELKSLLWIITKVKAD
ncbi:MAG: hypothetical protein ACTSQE_01935 [Candidatus Heimdallarchaeaceae archaeon]